AAGCRATKARRRTSADASARGHTQSPSLVRCRRRGAWYAIRCSAYTPPRRRSSGARRARISAVGSRTLMAKVVLVGAQWGDEGKGKVVDLYTEFADVVFRYGGGPNAGHTLVVDGQKLITRLIPSGVLRGRGKKCVLGDGMVVDPKTLLEEIDGCKARGLLAD